MRKSFNGTFPITRKFGVVDPAYSNYPGSQHPGTDYGLPVNTPLVAGMGGTVSIYDRNPNIHTGRGKEVVIVSGDKQRKTCHMNRIDVESGQTVTEGQAIGLSGNTGYSSGPHLHDELLVKGQYVDLEKNLSEGETMPTQKQVLDHFNAYGVKGKLANGDPSQEQLDYYSTRPWSVLYVDLLTFNHDRRLELEKTSPTVLKSGIYKVN